MLTIKEIANEAGGIVAMSLALGLSRAAANNWQRVPPEHVLKLAELTGWRCTPNQIRPDLYPHPHDGLPEHLREAA